MGSEEREPQIIGAHRTETALYIPFTKYLALNIFFSYTA
jgi:hypothetical protein